MAKHLTFLFTDIEGSSALWERYPDLMAESLRIHDSILRDTIVDHGGTVFKTVGDAFCAVFPNADRGLAAATTGQDRLEKQTWPTPPVRVRMGLHAGSALERDGDYFGDTVNRAARIADAGHGGQVLISDSVHALVTTGLQDDPIPLGNHFLKGLSSSVSLYQAHPRSADVTFPPIRTVDRCPNNLPATRTSFVGRGNELTQLELTLQKSRIATLWGAGGVGKTRLCLEFAHQSKTRFPDGIWFIDLVEATSREDIFRLAATACGLPIQDPDATREAVMLFAACRSCLWIFDNCEHVGLESAEVVDALLLAGSSPRVLATSREPLELDGEALVRLQPLADEGAELFMERARLVVPDFDLTDDNRSLVESACSGVDGLALGIELAAARLRNMSLEDLVTSLESGLGSLRSRSRSYHSRQRSLVDLIDWSVQLLTEKERDFLFGLAAFVSPFDEQAAGLVALDATDIDLLTIHPMEWVFENPEEEEPGLPRPRPTASVAGQSRDLLERLENSSLIVRKDTTGGVRYRLLGSVRQALLELDGGRGRVDRARQRELRRLTALAEFGAVEQYRRNYRHWLDWTEDNWGSIAEILQWSQSHPDLVPVAARLASAPWRYYVLRNRMAEGIQICEEYLAFPESAYSLEARWKTMFHLIAMYVWTGQVGKAQALADIQEDVAARTKVEGFRVFALMGRSIAMAYDAPEKALELERKTLAATERLGFLPGKLIGLHNIGLLLQLLNRTDEAFACYRNAADLARKIGDEWQLATNISTLAYAQMLGGDYDRADENLSEAIVLTEEFGDQFRIGADLVMKGRIAVLRGNLRAARSFFSHAREFHEQYHNESAVASCLAAAAFLSAAEDRGEDALGDLRAACMVWRPSPDPESCLLMAFWLRRTLETLDIPAPANMVMELDGVLGQFAQYLTVDERMWWEQTNPRGPEMDPVDPRERVARATKEILGVLREGPA